VIVGQDPYPTPGHATGLAFGMENGAGPLPRSLKNIYKEIADAYQIAPTLLEKRGSDLVGWAQQGVLLLNSVLSVRQGPEQAGSHRGQGWESLTQLILKSLNEQPEGICFLLWGKPAQEKKKWLQAPQHLVLEAAHPSPLSANRGFFGCNHFRLANEFLENQRKRPGIDWGRVTG
jgi:uracil-DNA glycosylase